MARSPCGRRGTGPLDPKAVSHPRPRTRSATSVYAIDPSGSFVAAVRERFRGVDVRLATAEQIPCGDREAIGALGLGLAMAIVVQERWGELEPALARLHRAAIRGSAVARGRDRRARRDGR